MPKIDLFIYDHGSVWIIEPASIRAWSWVRENVQTEPWQIGQRITGDWRPMAEIVRGAQADGLVVSEG